VHLLAVVQKLKKKNGFSTIYSGDVIMNEMFFQGQFDEKVCIKVLVCFSSFGKLSGIGPRVSQRVNIQCLCL